MMLPALGAISAYTFTTEFATLNGIYALTELMTYDKAVASGVDFLASLYTPAGVSSAQFTIDAPNYAQDNVLVLTPVTGSTQTTVIYAPESIIAMIPDSMIGCYNNLAIGIPLGLFDNNAQLTWVLNEINSILTATLGINNPATLYSLGVEYQKISDYEALVAQRKSAASNYITLYQQLQSQIQLTAEAQNLVKYYQDTLIQLAAS